MTKDELLQLLAWRRKRGYKGLSLRGDGKAWCVVFEKKGAKTRTSKNFPFTAKYDMHVLFQLNEACEYLEQVTAKVNPDIKMFGETRVSRLKHKITDGNDMEGVLLEWHSNNSVRIQFLAHMLDPNAPVKRFKFSVPIKIRDDWRLGWTLAFARNIRALMVDGKHNNLTEGNIKAAWKEFCQNLKEDNGPLY